MGQRNASVYSENVFLLSTRSMMHCIRSPPADFRPLMQVPCGWNRIHPPATETLDLSLSSRDLGGQRG